MNPLDRFGEQWGNRQLKQVGKLLLGRNRDRVGNDDRIDRGVPHSLDRRSAQNAVRAGDVDCRCAGFVYQPGGAANRTRCADHVIKHHRHFAFQWSTDDVLLTDLRSARATFVDNCQRCPKPFCMAHGPLDAAFVGTDNDDFVIRQAQD